MPSKYNGELLWMISLNSLKLSTEKTEDLKLMGLC